MCSGNVRWKLNISELYMGHNSQFGQSIFKCQTHFSQPDISLDNKEKANVYDFVCPQKKVLKVQVNAYWTWTLGSELITFKCNAIPGYDKDFKKYDYFPLNYHQLIAL